MLINVHAHAKSAHVADIISGSRAAQMLGRPRQNRSGRSADAESQLKLLSWSYIYQVDFFNDIMASGCDEV